MYEVYIYESHSNLQLPLQILGEKLKELILVIGEKELGSRQSLQDSHGVIPEKKTQLTKPWRIELRTR
jgi:hypothetical protein